MKNATRGFKDDESESDDESVDDDEFDDYLDKIAGAGNLIRQTSIKIKRTKQKHYFRLSLEFIINIFYFPFR